MGVKANSSRSYLDILFTKHGEWLMSLFLEALYLQLDTVRAADQPIQDRVSHGRVAAER